MLSAIAGSEIVIAPTPNAHFGAGAVGKLPGIVRGLGSDGVVVVTDAALAATPVVARVTGVLEAARIPVTVFSGVHPNPTTDGRPQRSIWLSDCRGGFRPVLW
jgi:alcohol dehydrogenase